MGWLGRLLGKSARHVEGLVKKAAATLPDANSDEIPPPDHQRHVHALASRLLALDGAGRQTLLGLLQKHPLLGLEVLDEALVLNKNATNTWGVRTPENLALSMLYNGFDTRVTSLRGRPRHSTSPTLKGGASRQARAEDREVVDVLRKMTSASGASHGSVRHIEMILALKHLRIRFDPATLGRPAEFSRRTTLLQGSREVPQAATTRVDRFLATVPNVEPRPDPAWDMLGARSCEGWPPAPTLAVRGVMAFGPGDVATARACARRALELDRDCTLARQLVSLLEAPFDPRVPFGAPESAWPSLPDRLRP